MEFENLQIEVPKDDESSPLYGVKVYEKKYHNKKDFVVGFNPTDKEFQERKTHRAKRFGIKDSEKQPENQLETDTVTTPKISKKENNKETLVPFDVNFFNELDLKKLNWPAVPDSALEEMRLDAIHLYGVEHMSTKDIFEYFKLFGPDTLEWIDDYSCNVVWEDEQSVVRAMDNMSKPYAVLKKMHNATGPKFHMRPPSPETDLMTAGDVKIEVEDGSEDVNTVVLTDDEDIDPKDVWRVGYAYKDTQLFLRPATISDKKMPGAASRSQYYLLYGKKGDSQVPGIVSKSRKRKLQEMKKRANEIFKTKEPAVKIISLEELDAKPGVNKMEVDDVEEPVVKRMNLNIDEKSTLTMVADRVEVAKRLGTRYDDAHGTTVYDRLGLVDGGQVDEDDVSRNERGGSNVKDRLGRTAMGGIHDRLGKRDDRQQNVSDARKDIERLRTKKVDSKNSRSKYREAGYEDADGVYHDIYRVDDNIKTNSDSDIERSTRSRKDDSSTKRRNNNSVKNRLGEKSNMDSNEKTDLRGRLKKATRDRPNLDSERTNEKLSKDRLNLCIEIKQEQLDILDYDIEMDIGDENFEF